MAVYVIGRSKQTSSSTETLRRVTKREHCPICNDSDWCEIRSDGAVHCMRTESDRPCEVRMGGWWHNLPTSNAHPVVRTTPTPKPPTPPLAPADQRNAVYQALLDACQLSAPHEAYLLGCGLAQSMPASYATLNGNRDAVAAQLQRAFSGDVLAGVPGLFLHPAGTLGIASSDGLLLAVRDTSGRITRLQSRCEIGDGSKVYRWLSSSNHGGPSSGAVAHYADGPDKRWLWITEGVKKAEVLAQQTGQPAIGLPGHGALTAGLALLDEAIKQFDFAGVKLAFDEDADESTAAAVDKSRQAWIMALAERDLAVRVARWPNAEGKGIDDLLLGGHHPLLEKPHWEFPIEATADPGSADRGVRLTRDQKAARYDHLDNLFWNRDCSDPDQPKKSMLLSQKATLWAAWRFGGFPGEEPAPAPRRVPIAVMETCLGISGETLAANLGSLKAAGLQQYQHHRESNGFTSVSLAALRPLGRNETVPKPERTEQKRRAAAVRRCGSCPHGVLHKQSRTRYVCTECGDVTEETPWVDSESPREQPQWEIPNEAPEEPAENTVPPYKAGGAILSATDPVPAYASTDHSPLIIGSALDYRSAPTQRECSALLDPPTLKDGWQCGRCGGAEGVPNVTGTWCTCSACGISTRADSCIASPASTPLFVDTGGDKEAAARVLAFLTQRRE